jgi:hydroxyacylglutathione hydrolase
MIHVVLPVGMLQCNCSILGDEQAREAIVVDPGDEIDEILQVLAQHQLKVTAIFITHAHIDHVAGAQRLRAVTGAPVYMNSNDAALLEMLDVQASWLGVAVPPKVEVDVATADGSALKLAGRDLEVLATPGHTQGSQCLWIPSEGKLIAGDTLFRESIGRTDLPGGNSRQILSSIKAQLLRLPDETRVTPGHGPETTIGHERERNPFLQGI